MHRWGYFHSSAPVTVSVALGTMRAASRGMPGTLVRTGSISMAIDRSGRRMQGLSGTPFPTQEKGTGGLQLRHLVGQGLRKVVRFALREEGLRVRV